MERIIYYIAIIFGSAIGSYIPTLFGVGFFSLWSIAGSALGAILGLYLAYKFITS